MSYGSCNVRVLWFGRTPRVPLRFAYPGNSVSGMSYGSSSTESGLARDEPDLPRTRKKIYHHDTLFLLDLCNKELSINQVSRLRCLPSIGPTITLNLPRSNHFVSKPPKDSILLSASVIRVGIHLALFDFNGECLSCYRVVLGFVS